MNAIKQVAERTGLPMYGDGIRSCNVSPGGGVTVGGWPEDTGGLHIWVENYYSGNRQVAPLVNHENWLVIRGGFEDVVHVERPITREECIALADHFLRVAQHDCWPRA